MKIVAMLVWNEFVNDARVLKEAQTLQSAGYQVVIHALHTPGVTEKREVLPSGIKVTRIARSPFWKLRRRGQPLEDRSTAAACSEQNKPTQRKTGTLPQTPLRLLLEMVARLWTHAGLAFELVRSRPDAIHAHDANVLPTAWLAARISRVPLIYDAHEISTDREGYASFRGLVGWVEKRLAPRAAGMITTTDERAKFFARAYGVPRPLVLQNRPRRTTVEGDGRIRRELDLKEPWPIVLYQGGLQQGRGLENLVSAAAQVENAYFVFIGGGRLEQPLKALNAELGLQHRVFFIPTVSLADLPAYTASADIGVQPIENTCLNHFSTDSNKLFEYAMAGLPVVASDLPEIRKVVRKYDLGPLVPPGDADALAGAIQRLTEDAQARAAYRERALSAAGELNWEAQEGELLDLYRRVLKSRAGGSG